MTTFIGVAVGLCLLYLLMSILCSYLKEAIAAAFGMRAKFLELGLKRLLAVGNAALKDKSGKEFDLVKSILAHPLVQSLAQSPGSKPTYIPDHIFVAAMETVLAEKLGSNPAFGDILSKLPGDSDLARSLDPIIRDIEVDPPRCRAAVSTWFNEAMDRVAGWYKRRAQVILFAAGIVAAAVLNADSINVATRLWSDSSLRDQVGVVASGVMRSIPPAAVTPASPAAVGGAGSTAQPDSALTKQLTDALAGLQQTSAQLYKLPIGWDSGARSQWTAWRTNWAACLLAVCGWVLTGLAASLGAPFWFDLLGKAINMRMAGPAPQPSASAAATAANPAQQPPVQNPALQPVALVPTNPAVQPAPATVAPAVANPAAQPIVIKG